MTVYSHSRLSCFEQCPYKYKLSYIDKVETEIPESIEAFLGNRVHEVLQKLYEDLKFQKQNSHEDLKKYLHEIWEKNWDDSIVIVKKEYTKDNYLKMAEKFIADYYNRYHPFDQGRTIVLEDRILITLDSEGDYKLQGYIDRLVESCDGFYEIHDYKTNARLPLPSEIKSDRQLALYMIGVKSNYPDVKGVKLIWHFLAFDKEIDSTRSDDELEALKKETIALIDKIESEEKFVAKTSFLCDWCEYKPVCKQWVHLYKIKEMPESKYLSEPGVKLVNRYAELKEKKKKFVDEVESELEEIEKALFSFAEKEKVDVVFGNENKVRIKETETVKFPSKSSKEREKLEKLLKENGIWKEVDQLDTAALNKLLNENIIDKELVGEINKFIKLEKSKRVYLSKI
ncbi:MAG: PD-(D/E)XK nuclease family protein [Thermoplasmatales archaeon]|nr:MAG: PD-(D/E)XK nuclease family protein [Thermoplasmatales archaeon]